MADVEQEFKSLLAQGAAYSTNVNSFIKNLIAEIILREQTIKKLTDKIESLDTLPCEDKDPPKPKSGIIESKSLSGSTNKK